MLACNWALAYTSMLTRLCVLAVAAAQIGKSDTAGLPAAAAARTHEQTNVETDRVPGELVIFRDHVVDKLVDDFCASPGTDTFTSIVRDASRVQSALSQDTERACRSPGAASTHGSACIENLFGLVESTASNCMCSTACGASLSHGLGRCDWCYTRDGCGLKGFAGSWDTCSNEPLARFDHLDRRQKLEYMWSAFLSAELATGRSTLLNFLRVSSHTTFHRISDLRPMTRARSVHQQNPVCKVALDISPRSEYTGILGSGVYATGVMRIGQAVDPGFVGGVTPGLGLKIFRTGSPSADVVMNAVSAQVDGSYDFFESAFSHHIPYSASSVAQRVLRLSSGGVTACPNMLGISDLCASDADGIEPANVRCPYRLELTSGLSTPPESCTSQTCDTALIAALVPGSVAFNVTAFADADSDGVHLGQIVVLDRCVSSQFAEDRLFFKHQAIEEDWGLRPDFKTQALAAGSCGPWDPGQASEYSVTCSV